MDERTNPYRASPVTLVHDVQRLEYENARLRRFVMALVFSVLVLGGAAAWWFSLLWKIVQGER
jgi:hypothetical protein